MALSFIWFSCTQFFTVSGNFVMLLHSRMVFFAYPLQNKIKIQSTPTFPAFYCSVLKAYANRIEFSK